MRYFHSSVPLEAFRGLSSLFMSFTYKPSPPLHWTWLRMTGPDAQDYLHRMTTVNARELASGHGTPGCFLTPQGKIRSSFTLWMLAEGDYAFELDSGCEDRWKSALMTAVDQFHFGEQFVLHDHPKGFECLWVFPDEVTGESVPQSGHEPRSGHEIDEVSGCHVLRQSGQEYGRPWTTVWGTAPQLEAWQAKSLPTCEPIDYARIEAWRIASLRPRVDVELREDSIPLEIGLKAAIADNKGCYPGQEVIEKIVALGSPARRLVLIEGAVPAPSPGDRIHGAVESHPEVGQVTSVSEEAGRFRALGVLRKTHAKEGLELKMGTGSHGIVVRVAPYV